jgi:hypothetical protein
MDEPIKANVALPCVVRSPASTEAGVEGVTDELTRDRIVLRLPAGPPALSLRPGLAVVVDIELPVSDGRSPRHLECTAAVHSTQLLGDAVQVLLDVSSMNFISPKTAVGGPHPPWM